MSGQLMEPTTTPQSTSVDEFADELKPGTTLLHGQYVIESFLNSGGFGMTYLAKDSLDRTVVIKECFPASFCCRSETEVRARSRSQQKDFKSIVRLFGQEARRLAKLNHPNIVGVHQVFEDNETAYMALDFIDGQDMLDILEQNTQNLTPTEIRKILMKLLDAVSFIHERNILHRDISPDNILLDKTGNPMLIDFGAAREKATKASRALSALLVVKDGYSPQEFYLAGSVQSPSSDLYALAATFYHLIAGEAPPNSQLRLAAIAAHEPDPYILLKNRSSGFDTSFIAAIDKTLNVFPKDRIQSAQDWMAAIDTDKRTEAALAKAQSDESTMLAISRLVTEANQAALNDIENIHSDAAATSDQPAKQTQGNARDNISARLGVRTDVPATPMHPDATPVTKSMAKITEKPPVAKFDPLIAPEPKRASRKFWFFGKPKANYFGKADR
ncbi:MAG: serine/threonine protein kinase [Paracoccaceae bacterium]